MRDSALASLFRQPVFRSGGATHRPPTPPRQNPFLAAESLVALVSPCPTKYGFSIDNSTRNTHGAPSVAAFHGARSHDRGTRDEWIQSLALHRLAAKASAVQTELRRYPCLALVRESHGRRWHRGRAAGSAGARQKERPSRSCCAAHSAVGWAVTLKCRMRRHSWANTRNA